MDKIDEQSRSLVGSVLVVVGFLLAAGTTGTTKIVEVSYLYFMGISLLVSSIFIVFTILSKRRKTMIDIHYILKISSETTYENILRGMDKSRVVALLQNNNSNNSKERLLYLAWTLLILGLIVVVTYLVTLLLIARGN